MTAKIERFGGIAPKVSPNLLPNAYGVTATNLRIDSGVIVPLKGTTLSTTVSNLVRSIYRYDGTGTDMWLTWNTPGVDVVKSPVPNDAYDRVYFTGDGEPKYNHSININNSGSAFLLGMPRPAFAPILSTSGPTSEQVTSGKTFTSQSTQTPGNPSGSLTLSGNATVTTPSTVAATALVTGRRYKIVTIGSTNFTLVGASTNAVDTVFVATGPGTGTGTAIAANGLARTTAGARWSVSGYSTESYVNACAVSFSIPLRAYAAACGLNSDPTTNTLLKSIDYAVVGEADGTWSIYESNKKIKNYGKKEDDDVFEIEYAGTSITYRQNGQVIRTVKTVGNRTFYVDTSLDGPASGTGTFSEIWAIDFGTYTVPVAANTVFQAGSLTLTTSDARTSVSKNSITKVRFGKESMSASAWNSQATSSESYVDKAVVRFSFGSTTKAAAIGLNKPSLVKTGYQDIDYALVTASNGHVFVYENGTQRADAGVFSTTDVFQIESDGTQVKYTKNNGSPIYTSGVAVTTGSRFYVDTSLKDIGASINGIVFGQYVDDPTAVDQANQIAQDAVTAQVTIADRTYVYSYVSPLGEEGPPSPAGVITVDVLQKVTLTFNTANFSNEMTPSGATASYNLGAGARRRIYRTATGATDTQFLFVADVDISQSTFDDTLKDEALGELLPSLNWYAPPSTMQGIVGTPNGFVVGFNGNTICPSELFLPHAYNPFNQLSFPSDVTGIAPVGDSLLVFTKTKPFLVTGNNPEGLSAIVIDHPQTCVNKRSIVNMHGYVMFASPDGLVSAVANDMTVVTKDLLTRDQWQAYSPSTLRGFYYEGIYVGITDTTQFMLDMRGQEPQLITLSGFDVVGGYNDLQNDILYLIASDGTINTWETGANKTFTWKSKPTFMSSPVCPSAMRVYADGSVTATLYADDVQVFSSTITDSKIIRLPGGYRAMKFQIQLSGSARVQSVAFAQAASELL